MEGMGLQPSLYSSLCVLLSIATLSAAVLTEEPNRQYTVTEGDVLEIPCRSDEPIFHQVWTKGGVTITDSDPDFIISENSSSLIISSADHTAHNGSYSCTIVELDSDNLEAEFTITVQYIGTDISLYRDNQQCVPNLNTAYLDGSLTLECIAPDGYPMVNVTWYRSGVKLRQVEEPTIDFANSRREMTISSLVPGDTGTYHCEAANNVNRNNPLQSEELYIMVEEPDTASRTLSITDSDHVLIVGVGNSAEIVCKIVPEVHVDTVVWYHNSELLSHDDEGINILQRGAEGLQCCNKLIITSVSQEHEGVYECRYTESHNLHAQRQLSLAALDGPLIVEATPTNLTAPGLSLRLVCRLSDDALPNRNNIPLENLTYWTHNGSDINIKERELIISSTTLEDSGHYVCAINTTSYNINDHITASIDITVEASPSVSIDLVKSQSVYDDIADNVVYVELGASITIICTITSTRISNFTWLTQTDGVIFTDITSSSMSTHTLSHLTLSQLTSYQCLISDSVHMVKTPRLLLNETTQPYVKDAAAGVQEEQFENGTTLHLSCEVRQGSVEDLTWVKGNMILINQTINVGGSLVVIVTNGNESILTIYGVTTYDAGTYECVISDNGMESRLVFNVTITVPGKIERTSSQDVTATTGDHVQFDCITSGIPQPTINWLYNTEPVNEELLMVQDLRNGSLYINSVTLAHAGPYHCYLSENSETEKFILTVIENEEDNTGLQCGGDFTRDDCITLVSGGAGAVFILLLTLIILLVCVSILCRRWRQGTYNTRHDIEMKRVLSSRASSHKDNGPTAATNIMTSDSNYVESHGYGKGLYPASVPMSLYDRTILSDMQRSVTPPAPSPVLQTPGTGGTDSMFSTDDQSSLTASLPNFPRTHLKLGEELGEGEFGPVILGVARNIVSHEDTTQVVVKVLVRSGDGDDQFQPDLALVDFANQMKIEYEHIACILGMCTETEPYYVIYEYLDQGDLKKYLLTHRPVYGQPTVFTPHSLSRLVLQVADGMAFLFSQRIIHGDLATRNCLVSSNHHVKIADLGIGHDLYQTDYYDNGSQLLPIRWMPPELLVATDDGPAFSLHSDIWSFGILCWEVFMFGQLPYEGLADVEVLERVLQGELLTLPPSDICPDRIQNVMTRCWRQDPETRPRFTDLCMDINIAATTD